MSMALRCLQCKFSFNLLLLCFMLCPSNMPNTGWLGQGHVSGLFKENQILEPYHSLSCA